MVSCCRLLGITSFVLAAFQVGQIRVNPHQNKCYSLFGNFLSKGVILLKVIALRIIGEGRGGIKFWLHTSSQLLTINKSHKQRDIITPQ